MNLCQYCNKEFRSAKTLSAHMCVKKRRWLDKDTIGARVGFRVYQRFYELATNVKKAKTQENFINDRDYSAFVKFGRYLADLNPISAEDFIDYVIKNSIPIKKWTFSSTYGDFLNHHINKESIERAIERSILEMQKWATANNTNLNMFFSEISTFEAVLLIKSGRISPWILYLAPSSAQLFDRFSEEQYSMISESINPAVWQEKMLSNTEDTSFVRKVLTGAGL